MQNKNANFERRLFEAFSCLGLNIIFCKPGQSVVTMLRQQRCISHRTTDKTCFFKKKKSGYQKFVWLLRQFGSYSKTSYCTLINIKLPSAFQ